MEAVFINPPKDLSFMLKPEVSLNANKSNEQTGKVHQTYHPKSTDSLIDVINKAVKLQQRLQELSKYLFQDGDFDKEFYDAQERLQQIINNDLRPMVGALVVNNAYEAERRVQ